MSTRESLLRYSLIIKILRKGPANFIEIADFLSLESNLQGYNLNVSKRTFQRDLEDIRSVYNLDIQYDFSRKMYRIHSDEQSDVNERILEAFDVFNALNIKDRLSDYIHFEKRKAQGTEHLYDLLFSIKNKFIIKFRYQKYGENIVSERSVEPYALKEFKNRWYLVANDSRDNKIKTFSLDRLTEPEITNKKFIFSEHFNINEHFKYCFGIINHTNQSPEEIVLSFDPFQGKYIKSLPLHDSQQILIDNDSELRIKLNLFISRDFLMELLSHGENLEVIEPKSLRDEMKTIHTNLSKKYG